MAPAANVGPTVSSVRVADRKIDDSEVQVSRAEEQVKVTKRIITFKVGLSAGHGLIIGPKKRFCATKRILDGLAQEAGECQAEKSIGDLV